MRYEGNSELSGTSWSGCGSGKISVMGEPVLAEPGLLCRQGLTAALERPENGSVDGRQVGEPAAILIGFDVAGPGDADFPQLAQVNLLGVERSDGPSR